MAASEALNMQGEPPPTPADSAAVAEAAAVTDTVAAATRWPQLIPIAQLLAVVLGVFAIIWNQQQTTDNLRTELSGEISSVETRLRAEISSLEAGLRAEISQLRIEVDGVETELGIQISELRAEVVENGQRLSRIEGFLGIGIPEAAQE